MAWQSTDILGGDIPQEWEEEFFMLCNLEKDDGVEVPKSEIESRQKEFAGLIDSSDEDERDIAYQVLGVMLMRVGAKIDEVIKDNIISAAYNDQYAKEDFGRSKVMKAFIQAISKY